MGRAVGKNEKFESPKLERFYLSWKVSLKLESLNELGKLSQGHFTIDFKISES